jgi:hypothetical protein
MKNTIFNNNLFSYNINYYYTQDIIKVERWKQLKELKK